VLRALCTLCFTPPASLGYILRTLLTRRWGLTVLMALCTLVFIPINVSAEGIGQPVTISVTVENQGPIQARPVQGFVPQSKSAGDVGADDLLSRKNAALASENAKLRNALREELHQAVSENVQQMVGKPKEQTAQGEAAEARTQARKLRKELASLRSTRAKPISNPNSPTAAEERGFEEELQKEEFAKEKKTEAAIRKLKEEVARVKSMHETKAAVATVDTTPKQPKAAAATQTEWSLPVKFWCTYSRNQEYPPITGLSTPFNTVPACVASFPESSPYNGFSYCNTTAKECEQCDHKLKQCKEQPPPKKDNNPHGFADLLNPKGFARAASIANGKLLKEIAEPKNQWNDGTPRSYFSKNCRFIPRTRTTGPCWSNGPSQIWLRTKYVKEQEPQWKKTYGKPCGSCIAPLNYNLQDGVCDSDQKCGWAFHRSIALSIPNVKNTFTYALKKWQVCLLKHPRIGSISTDITCQMEKRCVCTQCEPAAKCSCDDIPNEVSKEAAYKCASN